MMAMTHGGYVAAVWLGAAALFGGYAVTILRRGRKLSRQVPTEERRWS
ncbi:MAG: hypothetical protein PV358_10990 [Acidimicrobiales bacterium]|nr:hypothetical protein [Acidimicrobiales bacterium]